MPSGCQTSQPVGRRAAELMYSMISQDEPRSCIQLPPLHQYYSGHLVPTLGLVCVNLFYGSLAVATSKVLSLGIDPLFYIIAHNTVIFLFLLPFAVCFERHKWPERLNGKLAVHLLLLSLGGVMAFKVLILVGMQMTSPAIASAMNNLSPGLIFLLACCLRFEKFDSKCKYSIFKAIGTMLCLGGVIAVTMLQHSMDGFLSPSHLVDVIGTWPGPEWSTGCIYLFSAVFILSCTTILQASALEELPAPLSLTTITCIMGALFTVSTQLIYKGKLDPGKYNISTTLLVTYFTLSSVMASTCLAFQMWCIRRQGPVFVSMFFPIGTVTSTVLSAVVLGKFLTSGSLAGVFVMIAGLYIVLWAKRKECPPPMPVGCGDDAIDSEKIGAYKDVLQVPLLN